MSHPFAIRLRRFVHHPTTQLVVGLILVGTGTAEVVHDVVNTDHTWRVGVHHGVIILGVMQVLQNFPQMVDGMERWFKAIEVKDANAPPVEKD